MIVLEDTALYERLAAFFLLPASLLLWACSRTIRRDASAMDELDR